MMMMEGQAGDKNRKYKSPWWNCRFQLLLEEQLLRAVLSGICGRTAFTMGYR
jgi:hypothetical protein